MCPRMNSRLHKVDHFSATHLARLLLVSGWY